jgi:SAM-dependent methyltransferase
MTKTLDLGCGSLPRNPFQADELFGVDVRDDLESHVKRADLAIEPIPYEDESFEYVTAFDFIEHIPRIVYAPTRRNAFVEFMNEVYRVLKPGGLFFSQTPIYPHAAVFQDPTHVNFITNETFLLYFDDIHRLASMYGFNGAFRIVKHERRGSHLHAVLQKISVSESPEVDAAGAKRLRRIRRLRLFGQRFALVRWCLAKIGANQA